MSVLDTIIIINPISGSNKNKNFENLFNNFLDKEKFNWSLEYTKRSGHATELVLQALKEGIKKIIVVGGDGTINEAGKALIYKDASLGIIPSGSGNGLARHLKIPLNSEKAIQALNISKQYKIDSGSVNDLPFFCTAGTGFDAQVGQKFGESAQRGLRTYVRTSVSEYFSYKSQNYTIQIRDKTISSKAFILSFANTAQYGNNAFIAPLADIADGKLNITLVKPFPAFFLPDLVRRMFLGSIHLSRYVISESGAEFTVEREIEGAIHLDGEPIILGKGLKIKCHPASLSLLLSAPSEL